MNKLNKKETLWITGLENQKIDKLKEKIHDMFNIVNIKSNNIYLTNKRQTDIEKVENIEKTDKEEIEQQVETTEVFDDLLQKGKKIIIISNNKETEEVSA